MSAPLPTSELPSASRGTHSLQRVVMGHIVATLILGDCQEMLPMTCDAIVCDPPYPDYHAEAYGYADGLAEAFDRCADMLDNRIWSGPTGRSQGWWCEKCQKTVGGRDVTYDETHDQRAGGCGAKVV